MIHTILTHPGGAHKDDLLAVCVLAALHKAPIVRRDPSQADLDDPGVVIVDVGGSHDPSRSNFDHHHFPRSHAPTCALSLVLQHLGLYEDALLFCEWVETAEWFDSRGPNRTAEWLGVPRKVLSQLDSPVDKALLRAFAASNAHAPGELVYDLLALVGQDLLDTLQQARARLDDVERHVQRWSIPHGDDTIEALFLPRADALPDEPSGSLQEYIRVKGLGDRIAAIVYPDRRGKGYGIARYEDHPRLDFGRVAGEPDVHFAHTTGFVCKTTATEPARLQALVAMGWTQKAL